jgi:hypothetical protein
MPVVLIIAFLASLGVHSLLLFAPEIDWSAGSEPPTLIAELKTPPAPLPSLQPEAKAEVKPVAANRHPARRKPTASAAPRSVLSARDSPAATPAPVSAQEPDPAPVLQGSQELEAMPDLLPAIPSPLAHSAPVASQLPAHGRIRYRVDRGDQGFQIGFSIHDWEVVDGRYRITAVTETNGLVGFFRPLHFEVESRGRWTAAGLLPERVMTHQKGRASDQRAEFDWDALQLRIGDRPAQALRPGTQDLLSFPYQLGLLPDLGASRSLPIVTGKKYADYRVEVVGDEDVEVPAGTFRCLHLRVPGVATTELWLAYERALLPVKIQHVDRKGDLYVQVATAIEISQEPQ